MEGQVKKEKEKKRVTRKRSVGEKEKMIIYGREERMG